MGIDNRRRLPLSAYEEDLLTFIIQHIPKEALPLLAEIRKSVLDHGERGTSPSESVSILRMLVMHSLLHWSSKLNGGVPPATPNLPSNFAGETWLKLRRVMTSAAARDEVVNMQVNLIESCIDAARADIADIEAELAKRHSETGPVIDVDAERSDS